MPAFPVTSGDRFCEECRRQLLGVDPDGTGMHVAGMVTMITSTTFAEEGPEEVLIVDVICLNCFPSGRRNHA